MWQMPDGNMTAAPQASFFIFTAGTLLSNALLRLNPLAAILLFLASLRFLVMVLSAPHFADEAANMTLFAFAIAGIYLWVRTKRVREDALKWFMIPASINISFIFIQKFFPSISPIQSKEVCGLLGNAGISATFLAMTAPIFLKYLPIALPFLALSIFFCAGAVGAFALMAVALVYIFIRHRRIFVAALVICGFAVVLAFTYAPENFLLRLSYWSGTWDGIKHHWIMGWGPGTFDHVMSRVPMYESVYLGIPFNNEKYMMNHPANEFLFAWWNYGALFAFTALAYVYFLFKQLRYAALQPFLIIVAGVVVMSLFMLKPPTLFLLILAVGIYENILQNKGVEHGTCQV